MIAFAIGVHAFSASAQDLPTAAVLRTTSAPGVPETTGGAVDRLLRASLDHLGTVRVIGGVTLDLGEAQLAIGCMGETAECLTPIAEQVGADELVLPSLDRGGRELVLGILLFDRRAGSLRRVVRRADEEVELLDTIDGALRELFGLPAVPPEEQREFRGTGTTIAGHGPELAGPLVVGTIGFATLIAASITSAVFLGEADGYRQAPAPTTDAEAAALDARFSSAQTLAIASDVLWIAGGTALGVGIVWLMVEVLSATPARLARITPALSPSLAGVSLEAAW